MSDDKTRILTRAVHTIAFQCGNGHRIVVPAKLAGKRGTCSKCGVAVVIPLPSTLSEAKDDGPTPMVNPPPPAPAPIMPAPVGPVPAPAADAFAGLFPGGPPAEPPAAAEISIDVGGGAAEPVSGGSSAVGDVLAGDVPGDFAVPEDGSAADHPTAQLVARLWVERAHAGVVEIHLAGGSAPILPEWYEPRWSRGTHGLFASQATDGTVTLMAVAWESVQKIIVRGVRGLPDGMFE